MDEDSLNPEYGQKWWSSLIRETEAELDSKWRNAADRIVNRYLDDRTEDDDPGSLVSSTAAKKYNIFWANVQIIKSALYANPPKLMVTRQNGDAKDDVARTAALMLQRMLEIGLTKDASDIHAAFNYGVEDRLIPGMGQVWLRYDAVVEEREVVPAMPPVYSAAGRLLMPAQPAQRGDVVVDEFAACDYVHWRDFLWSPARTWEEVWWVARRVWMKKKQFVKRWGQKLYDEIKGNHKAQTRNGEGGFLPKGFSKGRVEVFEIWCEDTNKVYWMNHHAEELLEVKTDPLKLEDFFPCPQPLFATKTTKTLIPRADFTMVQDQYDELDVLNDRISTLTRALRVVGVYDKNNAEVGQMLTGSETNMIAVDNWAAFAEQGGLKGSVDWFPVETISKVLGELTIQRQAVIGQIYELTSISDIMRGATSPRETAKAQTLKAQYSSVRLQLTQKDVARWISHALKIKAEIIANNFQKQTIINQSQIMQTESAGLADQAAELLKSYQNSQYRIEVGEETLSLADYNAERELRTEYLTAVGQFISQAGLILEGSPEAMPFLLKIVQWVTASFRGSSDIETVLDEAIKQAGQPKPTPPDPKVEADKAKAAADLQRAQIDAERDVKLAQQSDQTKIAIADMQTKSAQAIASMNNDTKILLQQMQERLVAMTQAAEAERENTREQMEVMLSRVEQAHETIRQFAEHRNKLELQENEPEPAAKSGE